MERIVTYGPIVCFSFTILGLLSVIVFSVYVTVDDSPAEQKEKELVKDWNTRIKWFFYTQSFLLIIAIILLIYQLCEKRA